MALKTGNLNEKPKDAIKRVLNLDEVMVWFRSCDPV